MKDRTRRAIESYNRERQSESEAHLLTPEGDAERQARNAQTVAGMRAYYENGDEAYSYKTCIRTRLQDGTWVINSTFYTKTTTKHQKRAESVLFPCLPCTCAGDEGEGHASTCEKNPANYVAPKYILVEDVPQDSTAAYLRNLAILQDGVRACEGKVMLHLDAGHDRNGNPRRAWVMLDSSGDPLKVWSEGYAGSGAVDHPYRGLCKNALTIPTTAAFLRGLSKGAL